MPQHPLDPDAAAHLARLAALGLPGPETTAPARLREAEAQGLRAAPPPPVSVAGLREIRAHQDGVALRGRLYRPQGVPEDAPLPGLVYYHGGGFVVGSLDTHDHICRFLCRQARIAVLSVDYPLAPEHPFPAAVDSACAALAHAMAEAGALGLDPARIGVGGDSAGANLAAVAALDARARGRAMPAVQLLLYPAMDLTCAHVAPANTRPGDTFTVAALRWFYDQYVPRDAAGDWRASPLRAASLVGQPPAYVMTAGADPLAPDGAAYAARLAEAGVPVRERHFPGQAHAFLRSPQIIPTAWTALIDAAEFLVETLCGHPRA